MRFKTLSESEMTEAQRTVYREICAGQKGRLGAPTSVLLRSPEVAKRVQKLCEYVRFESPLSGRIMEFVIRITARYWSAQYVWHAHLPLALKGGLDAEVASELAQGKRPSGMKDDEAAAYQFCTELHYDKQVSDAAFDAAIKQFGEEGVLDLMAGSAYYTLQSMALVVNENWLPAGTPLPLAPLK